MGVDVDEARGDDPAPGVDLLGATPADIAQRDDLPVLHRDIALEQCPAAAVDDRPATDHQIMFAHTLRLSSRIFLILSFPRRQGPGIIHFG